MEELRWRIEVEERHLRRMLECMNSRIKSDLDLKYLERLEERIENIKNQLIMMESL